MFDGNVGTFWGSKWDAPKPLPITSFDMKKSIRSTVLVLLNQTMPGEGTLKTDI